MESGEFNERVSRNSRNKRNERMETLMTENEKVALNLFIKAARKFIDKVDSGMARSVETYSELKEALKYVSRERQ